ncbi:MAG: SAM-dependent methyltransferase, partial [Trebonia sp.]
PVAVLLIAVLHFIPDADDPYAIVRQLTDVLPAGSYLVICHAANDIYADEVAEGIRRYNASGPAQMRPRNHAEVLRFFDGLELIGPGVVPISDWLKEDDEPMAAYVGVARKP